MDIRQCGHGDEASVVALWLACGLTRPWNDPHTDFSLAIAGASSAVLAGFEGDALVASVMVGFDGHRGWVYYLAVDPTRQRLGHGRRMMDAAEAWLKARDAPKIQLMVRQDNAAAVAFYERLGFEDQPVATLGKRLDGH